MNNNTKMAVLKLNGANCLNCIYAIEHAGKRMERVKDIEVNSRLKEVYVEYEGDIKPLENIIEIVHKLGYEAQIKNPDINSSKK